MMTVPQDSCAIRVGTLASAYLIDVGDWYSTPAGASAVSRILALRTGVDDPSRRRIPNPWREFMLRLTGGPEGRAGLDGRSCPAGHTVAGHRLE